MNNNFSAMDIANYIIWHVNKESDKPLGSLTPLKIQKILYYVAANFLKRNHRLLFNDSFEKWQYGPVVTDVYHNLKNYGINHISEPVQTLEVDSKSPFGFKKVPFDKSIFDGNTEFTDIANEVIEKLIPFRAFDLVEMTHKEDAWKKFEPLILKGVKDLKYTKDDLLNAKDIKDIP